MHVRLFIQKSKIQILALCSSVLALLSGCFNQHGQIEVEVDYGVPSTTFKVSGLIRTQSDSLPVKGIQVSLLSNNSSYVTPPIITDSTGSFEHEMEFYTSDVSLTISVTDIDKAADGTYKGYDTLLSFNKSNMEQYKVDSWNYSITDINLYIAEEDEDTN